MEADKESLFIPSFGKREEPSTTRFVLKNHQFGSAGLSSSLPASPDPGLFDSPAKNNGSGKNQTQKGQPSSAASKKQTRRGVTAPDARWRLFFGLALFTVAFGVSFWVLNSSQKGVEVVIATREILAGQAITNADLSSARMSVSPELAANLYSSTELNLLTNPDNAAAAGTNRKLSSRLLRPHQPLMRGDIVPQAVLNKSGVPEGMVALAMPVSAATAASRINPDDFVTLLFVEKDIKVAQVSVVLAEKVRVLDVTRSNSGTILSNTGPTGSAAGSVLSGGLTRAPLSILLCW